MIIKLSSLNVLEIFTKSNLSVDIRVSRLQSCNDEYDGIVDSLEEIVDLVNSEGGWNIYEWGKRCLINDFILLGNNIKEPGVNKVLSQDISTHVVHCQPRKKYYFRISTIQERYLDNLKFEFYTL